MKKIHISILFLFLFFTACSQSKHEPTFVEWNSIVKGNQQFGLYLPLLKGKNVALVGNHTSVIKNTHLVDTLLSLKVNLVKVFGPEHGFRGNTHDGALIQDDRDIKTGLPIISLYGKHKKPTKEDLKDIDIVLFDIQDVGTRFYTYLSTMTYVMQACAENNVKMIVLDRPNPNGFYVDGSVLVKELKSFVGMHKVPIVHGLTLGEFALMINGEGWLKNKIKCDLEIIPLQNYNHSMIMELPIKPSPNLPNLNSILLYPSLCLFEGTVVSVGRGTSNPFEYIGHPAYPDKEFSFTPAPIQGASLYPPHKHVLCYGKNLKDYYKKLPKELGKIELNWIIDFYNNLPKDEFFNAYFEKLSGNKKLRKQIKEGKSSWQIHQSWKKEIEAYKKIRAKYILYPDFE